MIKTSTLLYLFDDISNPSDFLLPFNEQKSEADDYLGSILSLAEFDPGDDLVNRTIDKIKF
ncbi:MAG TPA: hypothetical protein VJ951_07730 [Bacteroidales bacterium]|nr:hypothetical protein [Bacteroidales bacterium]